MVSYFYCFTIKIMKQKRFIILTFIFLISAYSCNIPKQAERSIKEISFKQKTDWNIFIDSLIEIESENDSNAIGTKGSIGVLQITPIYVKEINKILGYKKYKLKDRRSKKKSIKMFEVFQNYFNPQKDINLAIKLHNPRAGQNYKNKILSKMKEYEFVSASY